MTSHLHIRDLFGEAAAGVVQRPGRSALTMLGTVLGVGVFVGVLGLTATAGNQISQRFTELAATEVYVQDVGNTSHDFPASSFPGDADDKATQLDGVRNAGVWWPLSNDVIETVHAGPGADNAASSAVSVFAASPGLLRAIRPEIREGRLYDGFHETHGQRVAVLGKGAASALGIGSLDQRPAIMISSTAFTVIGVVSDVEREPGLLNAVLIPRTTSEQLWGQAEPDQGAKMLVDADAGAAPVVATQIALALRPDKPDAFKVTPPPNPRDLREAVAADLSGLFFVLAGICLVVGAIGIANTTLVAVLERVPEIGLRRAVGARPRHIAAQFLAEAGLLGTIGGCLGASIGIIAVVVIAAVNEWTPVMDPSLLLPSPLLGTVVGVVSGVYPALRAARIEPMDALRSG